MVNQKRGCLYCFGIILCIATLPLSLPVFICMDWNKNEEPVEPQQTTAPAAAPVQVMLPTPLQNNHIQYKNNKRVPSLTPNEIAALEHSAPQPPV
jgi:hypothetical protein